MKDPTRGELLEKAREFAAPYGEEATEFDVEEACYWIANVYHGGQWTNLYSALSTSPYHPGLSSGPAWGSVAYYIYLKLGDWIEGSKECV